MIKALRGMKDITPPESKKFHYFLQQCEAIAQRYGYDYIKTPILEETKLFMRSVGESSDIVTKEMYNFIDKGQNDVCMRPEGTAGVVRSFVERKLDRAGGLHRYFYYGPMYRYERPQKGRFREFFQFGCESFGESSPYEDAQVIMLVKGILDRFNITTTLLLNSLGCEICMPPYRENLVGFLENNKEALCPECNNRITTNPIRTLDCKNEQCQSILQNAPKMDKALCDDCDTHHTTLLSILDDLGIAYTLDPTLVRGLDYYNKTAFEYVSSDLGAQSAVAGGGRYDKLVEYLDGRPTPAIGFAIGVDRLLELVEVDEDERQGYYFGAMDERALPLLLKAANTKRQRERVEFSPHTKSLKAHLKGADKVGARYCAIIGENELKNNHLWIKDLVTKDDRTEEIE
jgi:histidyl-tRNA synthetase